MNEGSMLRPYSDHGSMRHARPLTPAGIALTGSTLPCPACELPGALEGYRGNVQVQLCAACGFGYRKKREKPSGVVRKLKKLDKGAASSQKVNCEAREAALGYPCAHGIRASCPSEVRDMSESIQEKASRKYKEVKKALGIKAGRMVELMNAAPGDLREFRESAISVAVSPSGVRGMSAVYAYDIYAAALFVESMPHEGITGAQPRDDLECCIRSTPKVQQNSADISDADNESDISETAMSETTPESDIAPIRPAAFTPTDPGILEQHRLCDEWEMRTRKEAPVAGLVSLLDEHPDEDNLRGILDARLETLIGCSIDDIQAVSKQLDVLIYARRMNIVATVKIPSHEVSL